MGTHTTMTKTVLNVDICQVAWFLCFVASIFSASCMSGFQIWDRVRDISSGEYNPDGDILVSSVDSQFGSPMQPGTQPFNLLRMGVLPNLTDAGSNYAENGTITIGEASMDFKITGRWARVDTYHLHSIAICGLLGCISSCLATLNAVFNVKSRAFMCMQQIWIFFGFFFQLITMCMVAKYSDSMSGICPYPSYRIIGWIAVAAEFFALILYIMLDPSCFRMCRRVEYISPTSRVDVTMVGATDDGL